MSVPFSIKAVSLLPVQVSVSNYNVHPIQIMRVIIVNMYFRILTKPIFKFVFGMLLQKPAPQLHI